MELGLKLGSNDAGAVNFTSAPIIIFKSGGPTETTGRAGAVFFMIGVSAASTTFDVDFFIFFTEGGGTFGHYSYSSLLSLIGIRGGLIMMTLSPRTIIVPS